MLWDRASAQVLKDLTVLASMYPGASYRLGTCGEGMNIYVASMLLISTAHADIPNKIKRVSRSF